MKYITLITLFLSNSIMVLAQTIELRPSLGWGHGWGTNYKVNTNDNNNQSSTIFDRPITPSLELPQIGFMLDYNYKNKLVISVGRIHGKTELVTRINRGKSYGAGLIQK